MTKQNTKKTADARIKALREVYELAHNYIDKYFFFTDEDTAKVVALWAMSTWFLRSFDSFGYLAISAVLKRCGKSSLGQSISYMSRNYNLATDVTPAALFAAIDQAGDDGTTICIDEAEKLSNESHPLREMLNVGCYRGIGVMRSRVVEGERIADRFEVFGPKIFICIGDVFDTLRDRSIPITMTRMLGTVNKNRYLTMIAKPEGESIGKMMNSVEIQSLQSEQQEGGNLVRQTMLDVMLHTMEMDSRQLEMWCPVLTMAKLLDMPELMDMLFGISKRLRFEATSDAKSHHDLRQNETTQKVADFAEDLMSDLGQIVEKKNKDIPVSQVVAIVTAYNPLWSKFLGTGLTGDHIATMLKVHGIESKVARDPEKKKPRTKDSEWGNNNQAVARVYKADHIRKAYDGLLKAQGKKS